MCSVLRPHLAKADGIAAAIVAQNVVDLAPAPAGIFAPRQIPEAKSRHFSMQVFGKQACCCQHHAQSIWMPLDIMPQQIHDLSRQALPRLPSC